MSFASSCCGILLLLLLACTKSEPSNTMEEIELVDGAITRKFLIPSTFKAETSSPSRVNFSFQYPGMTTLNWRDAPRADEIRGQIMLRRREGRTEWLVANAADKFDPTNPGRLYRDGTHEGFEIYRNMLNKKTLKPESTLYVFRDDDGHLVGVNDPGRWSVNYVAWTKIDADVEIRYHIAKPLGNDFVTINRAVKKAVRSLIRP